MRRFAAILLLAVFLVVMFAQVALAAGDPLDALGNWLYGKILGAFFLIVAGVAVLFLVRHETTKLTAFLVVAAVVGLVLATKGSVFLKIGDYIGKIMG